MNHPAERAQEPPGRESNRPWLASVLWAAIVMTGLLFVAVIVNLAVGRIIHWDIVAGLGFLGLIFASIGRRYRTI